MNELYIFYRLGCMGFLSAGREGLVLTVNGLPHLRQFQRMGLEEMLSVEGNKVTYDYFINTFTPYLSKVRLL